MNRTRPELESAMWHAGLTRPQVNELLPVVDEYATSQAELAIDALTYKPPGLHWQVHQPWFGAACDPKSGKPCTTDRGRVTCGACKETPAWREAA